MFELKDKRKDRRDLASLKRNTILTRIMFKLKFAKSLFLQINLKQLVKLRDSIRFKNSLSQL